MPCYSPLHGFRARERSGNGKRAIVFQRSTGFEDMPVTLPCGGCIGCRVEKSRQWAMRCVHEASLHVRNCFVTLTYSDEYLPARGSLDRAAFPRFMKRLRKAYPDGIRFFHCGEYGEKNGRPHYHALLFGFDFPDKMPFTVRSGYQVWRSPHLARLWPFGLHEIGTVTFESAAYCARYVVKKVVGEDEEWYYQRLDADTGELYRLEPEYATMSRRPGIGRRWIDRYGTEVYQHDSVVVNGKECKPVRYYDSVLESVDPALMRSVKRARERAVCLDEQTWERLEAREAVAEARVATFARSEI